MLQKSEMIALIQLPKVLGPVSGAVASAGARNEMVLGQVYGF